MNQIQNIDHDKTNKKCTISAFLIHLFKDFCFCFRDNICHIVKAPADVKWKIREHATEVAFNAVNSLEGAGVFAVELFLTGDGQVVNLLVH